MNEPSRHSAETPNTIIARIEHQTRNHACKTAVIDGETRISYDQLWARAGAVAHELRRRGIQPGALVGVCMHRTWDLIATLCGVLRAGCAYVPLDPAYPRERVRYMLEHARASAVCVGDQTTADLCAGAAGCITTDAGPAGDGGPLPGPAPNDPAYVIYTSGSTGKPKGVVVEHQQVVAMSHALDLLIDQQERDGMLAAASVCFDTSVMETLGILSLGGTMILAENALALPTLPAADQVKACVMVPSAMQALLRTHRLPQNIRCVLFGGEALKPALVRQIHALPQQPRVVNCYGPTEDTVFSTTARVPVGAKVVTIGTSVPGSRAYILDENQAPVPVGQPGELYLAGTKLARGYLHDPAQTAARFVTTTHETIPETRLYRTGDLCQWLANGEIAFLGRVDQQVKIRGYRIELGEVETTLERMPGVDAAAAAALDGGVGQKLLTVYVVCRDQTITAERVKHYLAQRLPSYMVPKLVMQLDSLPLLPNDKLDRKRLPDLNQVRAASAAMAAAEKTEPHPWLGLVQSTVAELLNIKDAAVISPDQSFDSLGLDSLTIPELSSRLTRALGRKLPYEAIFKHPTPKALAHFIQHHEAGGEVHPYTPITGQVASNTLADFQGHIQSSHPTFQAAKVNAWSATDKAKLVGEVLKMVNDRRRNPYSKVIRTGSAGRGTVSDAYTSEEREAVIWTTNLYLGMNRDQTVINEARTALEQFGTGMGTSAAASGMTDLHLAFENEFAELTGKPSACLFPTGYTANVGVIAGLLGKNDVVVLDQLCHASIVDGARLCGATVRTFKHNDPADLAAVLESEVSPYRTVLVVFEGVYSMGEGAAPVAELVHTAKHYGALVLVDEAHSFGFYGERGAGICAAQGVTEQVDFIMTTLSKALGSLGGVIAASREHVDLLKSASRAYIFQASVSPADMAAALTALRRLSSDDTPRERLWDTTRYMRRRFSEAGYDLGTGDGPIVTPHFGDKDKLYGLVQGMFERGVQTSAVTYPIVESGRGRLRLICSAAHTREDVDKTLAALQDAEREYDQRQRVEQPSEEHDIGDLGRIEDWATALATYVRDLMQEGAPPIPNLAVTIAMPGEQAPVSFLIQDQDISLGTLDRPEVPTCTLRLTQANAVTALCDFDVQGLLQQICDGSCVLSGAVEPFVWLMGRLVDCNQTKQTV
ncbi:amino acid adenylation domain-containing protein [Acanthopleuribacter pedis]|uniref:Amino acid adenylation domain-containing protein n=1 Tax=Acanthopleuribacter pedis TaxID=442870 RepID=A0A8J7Q8W7_9BACT|nr:amino acid adenylation domain-containing protein [Acanthopleuribacter pedis]MBO1320716.1 amino acid adenylation domain-containing protein [Acanthopleuribacter pedis]